MYRSEQEEALYFFRRPYEYHKGPPHGIYIKIQYNIPTRMHTNCNIVLPYKSTNNGFIWLKNNNKNNKGEKVKMETG